MPNYELKARSNYFRVRDAQRFERWCRNFGLQFWTDHKLPGCADMFYAVSADNGAGWPSQNMIADVYQEIDFQAELRKHLDPRDIAVLYQTGDEGMRYLTGVATAIHADGRAVSVNLDNIYDRARETFGEALTLTAAIC